MDWSDKTILVAEDIESNYLYIEEILSPTRARLMRAKDGFEATQLIRKIKKDIPVIAQTAFTFEGEMVDGLYAGCFNDYVLKPFKIKVIYTLLEKYLYETP